MLAGGLGRSRVPPAAGGDAITVVDTIEQQFAAGTSHVLTDTLTASAGDTIVVFVRSGGGGAASAVSDGSAYTLERSQQVTSFGNFYTTAWTRENVAASTYTITVTPFASATATVIALLLRGSTAPTWEDANEASSNDDATSPLQLATAASVSASRLVLHCATSNHGSNQTWTAGSPFTKRSEQTTGGAGAGTMYVGSTFTSGSGVVTGDVAAAVVADQEQIIASFA